MNEQTMTRMPKSLLAELKKLKVAPKQSYADVVKKLLEKKRRKEQKLAGL